MDQASKLQQWYRQNLKFQKALLNLRTDLTKDEKKDAI
jgi:hypothetical protein